MSHKSCHLFFPIFAFQVSLTLIFEYFKIHDIQLFLWKLNGIEKLLGRDFFRREGLATLTRRRPIKPNLANFRVWRVIAKDWCDVDLSLNFDSYVSSITIILLFFEYQNLLNIIKIWSALNLSYSDSFYVTTVLGNYSSNTEICQIWFYRTPTA